MSVSTPVKCYIASLLVGGRLSGGASAANTGATIDASSLWEIQIPIQVVFGNCSADPLIKITRSCDGTNYETIPLLQFTIARTASAAVIQSITLPTGIYTINIQATISASAALTCQILTALGITAVSIA